MKGESIPHDVAYSRGGRPTCNPNEALRGALRPFDRSHKGSGLALMVELLTGAWVGGGLVNKAKAKNWGMWWMCGCCASVGNPDRLFGGCQATL